MKKLLISFLFLLACLTLFGQNSTNDNPKRKIILDLYAQQLIFPQEKVYLQTDKPYYITGEKIFFRAFILQAASREPSYLGRYVYVELVTSVNTVVLRQQIRINEDKMFYGTLTIPETYPQGNYRIRAYTRYMENMGEAYFYSRPVFIANPNAEEADAATPNVSNSLDITFYPEGGNLIAGQANQLAFKALFSDGKAAEIKGNVFNSKNELITTFATEHDGMGVFTIQPTSGERYYAQVTYQNQAMNWDILEAISNTCALQAVWQNNQLSVSVRKPESVPQQKYYLLIHRQGVPTYLEEWDFSQASKEWDKKTFASGVSHLMLLNDAFQVVSERMVFVNKHDEITAEIQPHQPSYKPREQVALTIQLSEMPADTLSGSFAISVTDDQDIKVDTTTNIIAEFLLVSELAGQVHYPAWYFRNDDEKTLHAADLLMLTNGWRRYHVKEALQGNLQQPKIKPELAYTFSGMLKDRKGKPYKNGYLKLKNLTYACEDLVQSDEQGRYRFENFESPDSTVYFLTAASSNLKTTNVDIVPNPITYPAVTIPWNFWDDWKQNLEDPEFAASISKADRKYVNENGAREVNLEGVTVQTHKRKKQERNVAKWLPADPDKTVSPDNIEKNPPTDFEDLLWRLPGAQVSPDGVVFRGKQASFVMDGQPVRGGYQELRSMVNVNDIAQVDLFTEIAKTLLFGGGANPVVAFTIWPSGSAPGVTFSNTLKLWPLGYQKPDEFYSPKYDTPEWLKSEDWRSTIYWKPNATPDNNGKASVEFYTAHTPSTYSVVIEGIGRHKTLIYHNGKAVIKVGL
ncbi:hypothetical protein AGMMS49525_07850 [Bacteroidia bacterium]|nr:hypothetical protein AGMMS49525_07850 [Bacteroidia bacterium]